MTIDTGSETDVFAGRLCTWIHTPRGGYGFSTPVDAEVLNYSKETGRVTIRVSTASGHPAKRVVAVGNLRERPAPVPT